jgi:MFS family permease
MRIVRRFLAALRAARRSPGAAIGMFGWLNGFTEPNVGARGAQIQARMGASDAALSLGWAGWPFGMFVAAVGGGRLVERYGARNVLLFGAALYWGGFAAIGFTSNPWMLGAVMGVVGVGNGLFDVAWVRLSTWYERKTQRELGEAAGLKNQLLNAFFSGGSVVAALVAAGLVALGVAVGWHLAAVGAVCLAVTFGWAGKLLPNLKARDAEDVVEERHGSAPWRLRRAGVVGFCAVLPLGVGYLWSPIYLTRLGAGSVVATSGLIAFTFFEMVVRIAVDQLAKSRHTAIRTFFNNPVKMTVTGACVALAGLALIVGPARIDTAIVGFGLLAGGMAPIAPFVQSAAARLWPAHKGAAGGLVTRYTYTALVLGPVVVGPLSSHLGSTDSPTSLRIALGCLVVLPLTIVAMARNLR